MVDASQRFLSDLKGVTEPEQKRKIIGRNFIDIFQEEGKRLEEAAKNSPQAGEIEWLLQGTLYPDVIESISFKGPSATIKTHHNVGGLPAAMHLKVRPVDPHNQTLLTDIAYRTSERTFQGRGS